jgi:hypothetical protein
MPSPSAARSRLRGQGRLAIFRRLYQWEDPEGDMAIPIALLPVGTRVRVRRSLLPQDPTVTGRTGVVVESSEYTPHMIGVALDEGGGIRNFGPGEIEVTEALALPPERQTAKRLRALP